MSSHDEAFEQFLNELDKSIGSEIEKLVLFGSLARGEETEESDVDVLVVLEDKGLKEKVFEISYDIMLETDVYVSPKVVSTEEFEELKDSSFMKQIREDGQEYGTA